MLGYSNVLTVTRGRTIRGQVPNAECAQWTNDDRTEPYVGAMVVREHYKKFKDIRLLELLYDLRTWNDWALAKRALPANSPPGPGGLISVGSDVVNTSPRWTHEAGCNLGEKPSAFYPPMNSYYTVHIEHLLYPL